MFHSFKPSCQISISAVTCRDSEIQNQFIIYRYRETNLLQYDASKQPSSQPSSAEYHLRQGTTIPNGNPHPNPTATPTTIAPRLSPTRSQADTTNIGLCPDGSPHEAPSWVFPDVEINLQKRVDVDSMDTS